MSVFSCWGCCVEASKEEREPIAQARPLKTSKELSKGETLLIRNVNVTDIDQTFTNVAVAYNEQVEHCRTINDCISGLADISCSEPSLSSCLRRLQERHDDCDIKVHMEGFNFSLVVNPENHVKEDLQQAQELIQKLSRAAKLINRNKTMLEEMINSLMRNKTEMEDKIDTLNVGHLDHIRFRDNLVANFQNINKAKQLSKEYEEEANKVLKEIANLSGSAD
ncbi:uncharacterized protein LOC128653703 [Bombina bombina]|uniref:uncharacterized protein LOC128653703 n=1 Tax=Bombina bombina TaxID=8345 RepID=UPI00235AD7C4|nr:uncharacterized protein LOC128653703 [Bombina bombina]